MSIIKNLLVVKIEFEKGSANDTALQPRIDAMRELKEKKVLRLTLKSKVLLSNCNHTAFVVHVKNLSLNLTT